MIEKWWKRNIGGMPVWATICSFVAVFVVFIAAATASPWFGKEPHTPAADRTPSVEPSEPPDTAQPTVLFIGDSYTAGLGADSPATSYTALTSEALGWQSRTSAEGSSGYETPGLNGGTMLTLAQNADYTDVQTVVLASSFNDPTTTDESFRAAVQAVITEVRAHAPEATIVLVGPWNPSIEVAEWRANHRDLLAAIAQENGFTFIDPAPWFAAEMIMPDGIHVNQAGHTAIGTNLADALRAAGVAT